MLRFEWRPEQAMEDGRVVAADAAMLETAELGQSLSKEAFGKQSKALRVELLKVQRELLGADWPVIILIGGVGTAGKGEVINRLFDWMDAKGLTSHVVDAPTQDERERPEYWRYWMGLPPKGMIGIFLGGWYAPAIDAHASGGLDDDAFGMALRRATMFERDLANDGALIIKIWLHVSKKVQKKRLIKLGSSAATRWRVTSDDWARHARYDAYRKTCERALRETSTGSAPWSVIDGGNARFRDLSAARTVLDRIRERLAAPVRRERGHAESTDLANPVTILDSLDLTRKVSDADYAKELEHWQGEMNQLGHRVKKKARGVIVLLEGWDASGKGGAIRRVTQALDARQYRVIPVSAPTDEEHARHYLWRFWRQLGRSGGFTFYDRSWYGRVLVERVEGLASVRAWQRAYKEINDFEEQLVEDGIILLKFWLHISRAEQLRRFKTREREPWKNYKISDEDYRNRTLTNAYEAAASDMIGRTSTEYAPWVLIEAEDKHFARIKVLREACKRIAARL